jgi:hypothetical protein
MWWDQDSDSYKHLSKKITKKASDTENDQEVNALSKSRRRGLPSLGAGETRAGLLRSHEIM